MTERPADDLTDLAAATGRALAARGWRLISAESCTGGLLAARITDVPGSSAWFEGAYVTYRLTAKMGMLGVPGDILDAHGAVSEPTVRAMAEGALARSMADVSVAITGIAGPEGGDVLTPVGTVWFGWAVRERDSSDTDTNTETDPGTVAAGGEAGRIECVQTEEHHLAGNRQVVREEAVRIALGGVLELLRARQG